MIGEVVLLGDEWRKDRLNRLPHILDEIRDLDDHVVDARRGHAQEVADHEEIDPTDTVRQQVAPGGRHRVPDEVPHIVRTEECRQQAPYGEQLPVERHADKCRDPGSYRRREGKLSESAPERSGCRHSNEEGKRLHERTRQHVVFHHLVGAGSGQQHRENPQRKQHERHGAEREHGFRLVQKVVCDKPRAEPDTRSSDQTCNRDEYETRTHHSGCRILIAGRASPAQEVDDRGVLPEHDEATGELDGHE